MTAKPDLSRIHPQLQPLAVPVSSLVLDMTNARRHDERNLQAITESIEHAGFRSILVVQKRGRVVRAGNGRLLVARRLGMTHVPAIVCDDKDVDAVLHALADNRTSDLSSFDPDRLEAVIGELVDAEVDLASLWTKDELSELLDGDDEDASTRSRKATPATKKGAPRRRRSVWSVIEQLRLAWDRVDSCDQHSRISELVAELVDLATRNAPRRAKHKGKRK